MAGDPSIIDGTSDAAVIDTWKALALHPLQHKWTMTQIVAAIIFATTISYFWTFVLRDVLEVDKILKG